MAMPEFLYASLYLLPKNWLSRVLGRLVDMPLPLGMHTRIKLWFIDHFQVDTLEAEHPVESYPTLGKFFVRKLKVGARPLDSSRLVSPVDGRITRYGGFAGNSMQLEQVKGRTFDLRGLVGPDIDIDPFQGGGYVTTYLAPFNYHRIHAPIQAELLAAHYIPGALWPVNDWSVRKIDGLFTVNERIILEMRDAERAKILLVMVGATNVGRITLECNRELCGNPVHATEAGRWVPESPLGIAKGEGVGCFEMGSTVILVLDEKLYPGCERAIRQRTDPIIKMGQGIHI